MVLADFLDLSMGLDGWNKWVMYEYATGLHLQIRDSRPAVGGHIHLCYIFKDTPKTKKCFNQVVVLVVFLIPSRSLTARP